MPQVQVLAENAERLLPGLVGAGDVAVERDGQVCGDLGMGV
jgi:hypothetical protein